MQNPLAIGLFTTLALLSAPIAAQTPNTLLIIADDFGVDALGIYGLNANTAPTPNIDSLASGGVRFENAYACPTCSPTRACMLTGRYGFRTGIGFPLGQDKTDSAQARPCYPKRSQPQA